MIATVVLTIKKVNEYVKVELCSKGSYTGNTGRYTLYTGAQVMLRIVT